MRGLFLFPCVLLAWCSIYGIMSSINYTRRGDNIYDPDTSVRVRRAKLATKVLRLRWIFNNSESNSQSSSGFSSGFLWAGNSREVFARRTDRFDSYNNLFFSIFCRVFYRHKSAKWITHARNATHNTKTQCERDCHQHWALENTHQQSNRVKDISGKVPHWSHDSFEHATWILWISYVKYMRF